DKPKTSSFASRALAVKMIMSLIGVGLVGFFVAITHPSPDIVQLFLLNAATLPLIAYASTVSSVFRGYEMMQYDAYSRAAIAALTTSIGITLVLNGFGIVALSVLTLVFTAVNALYLGLLNAKLKLAVFKFISDWGTYWSVVKRALPFAAVAFFVTISFRIDTAMLGLYKSPEVVGQYSAAYRLLEVLLIIPGLFAGVLLPNIAEKIRTSMDSLRKLVMFSIKYFGYLGIGLAVGCFMLAPQIINLLFGTGFPDSVLTLRILALALIPTFISSITSTVIAASDRPGINTYIALGMAVFNVTLNLLLIPRFSLYGAAVNTLLTESLGLLIGTICIVRLITPLPYYKQLIKPLVAGAVMAGAIALMPNLWLVPIYAAIYIGTLLVLRGINRQDLDYLKEAMPTRVRQALFNRTA
ncbi:MAG TPA: flippase, partial [Candidatus Polarisedimenticolaceae bacterium]|nr:flippase [Candidatus Polarisedimenticolaceae bacterium]